MRSFAPIHKPKMSRRDLILRKIGFVLIKIGSSKNKKESRLLISLGRELLPDIKKYRAPTIFASSYFPIGPRGEPICHTIIDTLCESQGWRCCYCGIKMIRGSTDAMPTIDHIITRKEGGKSVYENIVAACFLCNNLRGDMPAMIFFNKISGGRLRHRIPVSIRQRKSINKSIKKRKRRTIKERKATLADVWPK